MKNQVVYLLSNDSFLPYLVVSLYTLRQHWEGKVTVFAWEQAFPLAEELGKDMRLYVDVKKREPIEKGGRKKWQFLDKIHLMSTLDTDAALYLDADTTVHNPIDSIFDAVAEHGFVSTQFNDWTTGMRRIQKRVKKLTGIERIDQKLVQRVLRGAYPSPNGGVFACRPDSLVLPVWYEWTKAAMSIFIPDETVLHLFQPSFFRGVGILEGGRFNCSPKFQPKNLKDEEVVIYHHHGSSAVRPQKSPRSYAMWYPLYQDCMLQNVGGMAEWSCKIKNKWLDRLREKEKNNG